MARNIFIVNAAQVVVSSNNPHGMYSVMPNFPMTFDSRSYDATEQNPDGSTEKALNAAKAAYFSRLSANYSGSDTRVMAVVTLEQADGRQIMRDSIGAFPVVTSEPTPEPEPEPEEPVESEGE